MIRAGRLLARSARVIAYRPELVIPTGAPQAALLLSQIVYYWETSGRRPFYKLDAPADHPLYRPGDSWREVLHFGRDQLRTARKAIAVKASASTWEEALEDAVVVYWRGMDRITWYAVAEERLTQMVEALEAFLEAPSAATEALLVPARRGAELASSVLRLYYEGDPGGGVIPDPVLTGGTEEALAEDPPPVIPDPGITKVGDPSLRNAGSRPLEIPDRGSLQRDVIPDPGIRSNKEKRSKEADPEISINEERTKIGALPERGTGLQLQVDGRPVGDLVAEAITDAIATDPRLERLLGGAEAWGLAEDGTIWVAIRSPRAARWVMERPETLRIFVDYLEVAMGGRFKELAYFRPPGPATREELAVALRPVEAPEERGALASLDY